MTRRKLLSWLGIAPALPLLNVTQSVEVKSSIGDVAETVKLTESVSVSPETAGLTSEQIRDKIIPEITKILEANVRGFRDKWVKVLRDTNGSIEG